MTRAILTDWISEDNNSLHLHICVIALWTVDKKKKKKKSEIFRIRQLDAFVSIINCLGICVKKSLENLTNNCITLLFFRNSYRVQYMYR